MVGQALQHVADVDHDGVRVGGERHPLALVRLHFQAGRTGADQQRDEVDVAMGPGAHVRDVLRRDRGVMDRAQDRIAVVGLVGEEVLRQANVQRQRRQDARAQLVQRLVDPVTPLAEARHLARPQVRGHHLAVRGVVRDLPADVPELFQIKVLRALGGLHAEGRVAARAATARHVVLALGLFGQREEGLEDLVGGVDVGLRDAVVADASKAPFAVGRTQLSHERIAVGVETGDVEGGDLAHSDSCLFMVVGGPAVARLNIVPDRANPATDTLIQTDTMRAPRRPERANGDADAPPPLLLAPPA